MDTEIMEEAHEPLRRTTIATIYGDGTGWIELSASPYFTIESVNGSVTNVYDSRGRKCDYTWTLDGGLSIVGAHVRPHSKQTRAFLRSQDREKPAIHAHKRPVSTRRMIAYERNMQRELQAEHERFWKRYFMVPREGSSFVFFDMYKQAYT